MNENCKNDKVLPKVSIIVPIYNVEDYLIECVRSIIGQTFTEIEILLINDGSTDSCGNICGNLVKEDSRIRYFSKENEGLGPTRNYGVERALGEYMCFIDSDDWIEKTYVEILYNALIANDADLVKCNLKKSYSHSDNLFCVQVTGSMGVDYSIEELIKYGNAVIWTVMVKRSVWIKNRIEFPNMLSEDLAVHMYLLMSCNKVVVVPEMLYFYRKGRVGNISSGTKNIFEAIQALEYLIQSFKGNNMFEQHEPVLFRHVLRWQSRSLSPGLGKLDRKTYENLVIKRKRLLQEYFSNVNLEDSFVVGSYSLSQIIIHLPMLENPYNRYSFSSLIAIMAEGSIDLDSNHGNPYRDFMLRREWNKEFLNNIKEVKPKYLFIDFMEERFDIINYRGKYITNSDAFMELNIRNDEFQKIDRISEECTLIWKNACNVFIKYLKENLSNTTVVLVENYLSNQYFEDGNILEYENVRGIQAMNQVLQEYYEYFQEKYEDCVVIRSLKKCDYTTDINYEYGCYPHHYNERLYGDVANYISRKLGMDIY